MLSVYLNYPTGRVSAHGDPNCGRIRPMDKPDQRICRINVGTISSELQKFKVRQHSFQSTKDFNDMWLQIDFHDLEFELAVADFIRRLLARHYKPFSNAHLEIHC